MVAPRDGVDYGGPLRVQRDIAELLNDANAVKAGLIREELLALRLYTGPMVTSHTDVPYPDCQFRRFRVLCCMLGVFEQPNWIPDSETLKQYANLSMESLFRTSEPLICRYNPLDWLTLKLGLFQYVKYNAKLRNYPAEILEGMKGNGYVTTIHCIVSGVIKLSKVWTLPESKYVYRGLGGMMLPEPFWKTDEYGCKGGVERGLMSTTTDKAVAMKYSGSDSGRRIIFQIHVGQIDRGANLSWLSQYPKEEEVLMPPLSNLEVVGSPIIETSSSGPVLVIPLRVNVNIKSSTIEEVLKRRKVCFPGMVTSPTGKVGSVLTSKRTCRSFTYRCWRIWCTLRNAHCWPRSQRNFRATRRL